MRIRYFREYLSNYGHLMRQRNKHCNCRIRLHEKICDRSGFIDYIAHRIQTFIFALHISQSTYRSITEDLSALSYVVDLYNLILTYKHDTVFATVCTSANGMYANLSLCALATMTFSPAYISVFIIKYAVYTVSKRKSSSRRWIYLSIMMLLDYLNIYAFS